MYTKMLKHSLLVTTFIFFIQANDDEPMNAQFDVGRELITSDGYRQYFSEMRFVALENESEIIFSNGVAYGFTQWLGGIFSIPVILSRSNNNTETIQRGLSDIEATLQWHLYRTQEHMIAFNTGMLFPTGQLLPQFPIEGTSFSPVVRFIALHSSYNWFASFIIGGLAATPRKNRKPSSFIDYELAFGPKFRFGRKKDLVLYLFLELDSLHFFPEKINGMREPNTGQNVALLGPIIAFEKGAMQFTSRLLVAMTNNRFGIQDPIRYTSNVTLVFTF